MTTPSYPVLPTESEIVTYHVVPDAFLNAAALVAAHHHRDGDAVTRILADSDLTDLAVVLAQLLATAIRSPKFTLDEWLDLQADRAIEAAEENRLDAERTEQEEL